MWSWKLHYLDTFSKNTEYKFSKSIQWEPSCRCTDRQTDRQTKGQVCRYADRYDKLILIFRNFAKAHKR